MDDVYTCLKYGAYRIRGILLFLGVLGFELGWGLAEVHDARDLECIKIRSMGATWVRERERSLEAKGIGGATK